LNLTQRRNDAKKGNEKIEPDEVSGGGQSPPSAKVLLAFSLVASIDAVK
jgi:hypothetical protein